MREAPSHPRDAGLQGWRGLLSRQDRGGAGQRLQAGRMIWLVCAAIFLQLADWAPQLGQHNPPDGIDDHPDPCRRHECRERKDRRREEVLFDPVHGKSHQRDPAGNAAPDRVSPERLRYGAGHSRRHHSDKPTNLA